MNNKTVWNDPINLKKNIVHDNNSENFQIMNMEYKIKKIKNKKKKNGENYKKIPVFETIEVPIDNELLSIKQLNPAEIVDNISNSTNTDVNIITKILNMINDFTDKITDTFTKPFKSIKIFESFGPIMPNDYENCGDNKPCKGNSLRLYNLSEIIHWLYSHILFFNQYIAGIILACLASGDTTKNTFLAYFTLLNALNPYTEELLTSNMFPEQLKDIELVAHYIALFESITFASFFVYNWYYVMYFVEKDLPTFGNKPDLHFMINLTKISNYIETNKDSNSSKSFISVALIFYLFFFEFAIFFPTAFNYFIIHLIPEFVKEYINKTMQFSILYFCIILVLIYGIVTLKDLLIDMLSGIKSIFTGFMMFIVVILFIHYLFKDVIKQLNSPRPLTYIEYAGLVFKYIFRLIVVLIISVPIGSFLSALLFLWYSFFGIISHHGISFYDIILEIDEDVLLNSRKDFNLGCQSNSFLQKIIIFFENIKYWIYYFADKFFEYIFTITYIIMLIRSSFDYFNKLSNSKSWFNGFIRDYLILLNVLVIIFICLIRFNKPISNKVLTNINKITPNKSSKSNNNIGIKPTAVVNPIIPAAIVDHTKFLPENMVDPFKVINPVFNNLIGGGGGGGGGGDINS